MENIIDLLPERTGAFISRNEDTHEWTYYITELDDSYAIEYSFRLGIVIHTPEQAEKYAEQFKKMADRMRLMES